MKLTKQMLTEMVKEVVKEQSGNVAYALIHDMGYEGRTIKGIFSSVELAKKALKAYLNDGEEVDEYGPYPTLTIVSVSLNELVYDISGGKPIITVTEEEVEEIGTRKKSNL